MSDKPTFPAQLENKLSKLRRTFQEMESVLIAFSGGVDSTFLLKIAGGELKDKLLAITARSVIFPTEEVKAARQMAQKLGVKHKIIEITPLNNPSFSSNSPNRCYYCKKGIFSELRHLAGKNKLNSVVDGSNWDDTNDFRPGMRAARELGIRSPLIEAGLGKKEIRYLSRKMGLPTWDRPSQACLASRFPYGTKITREALRMVDKAESLVKTSGIHQVRVRHYGKLARIEVPIGQISRLVDEKNRSVLVEKLRDVGYAHITLDLEGYRSGSMNLDLPTKRKRS